MQFLAAGLRMVIPNTYLYDHHFPLLPLPIDPNRDYGKQQVLITSLT